MDFFHRFLRLVQYLGAALGVGIYQFASCLGQRNQAVSLRQQRSGLVKALAVEVELLQTVIQFALEQRVINLVLELQRSIIKCANRLQPAVVKTA